MLLFNVACGLAQRVPLTKLVELDGEVYPYLTALMGSCPSMGRRDLGSTRRHTHNHDNKVSLRQYAVEGGWP